MSRFAEYFRTNGRSRETWEIKRPVDITDVINENESEKDVFQRYAIKSLREEILQYNEDKALRDVQALLEENKDIKQLYERIMKTKEPIEKSGDVIAAAKTLVSHILNYLKANNGSRTEYALIGLSLLAMAVNIRNPAERKNIIGLARLVGNKGKRDSDA